MSPPSSSARSVFHPSMIEWRVILPLAAFVVLLGFIFFVQPRSMSYTGVRLLLNFSMPLVFAALAQMCIIILGDIDLGIGPFIALTACIAAAWLSTDPVLALAAFLACSCGYGLMGALIQARGIPSIVVTLGASFIWLGIAVLVMPRPGGAAPEWLSGLLRSRPPLVPMPVIVAVVAGTAMQWLISRSSLGVVLRGAGSNPTAVMRSGWSLMRIRVGLYALAGALGIMAGLALAGLNTTGDANIGSQYTLLSIAAVIVGGGQFVGGVVFPLGTVIGALIMLLVGALLSFVDVSTDWQLSVQGAMLVVVLAARGLLTRGRT